MNDRQSRAIDRQIKVAEYIGLMTLVGLAVFALLNAAARRWGAMLVDIGLIAYTVWYNRWYARRVERRIQKSRQGD